MLIRAKETLRSIAPIAVLEKLNSDTYIIRPEGALGTCGWIQGKPWDIWYVKPKEAQRALREYQRDLDERFQ